MPDPISEIRTTRYCIHPYFGFVCVPNAVLDYSDLIPTPLGHAAIAEIDEWGFRNRNRPAAKPPGETWIGIFGGSVAFGVASSSNDTTIAGYLEDALNRRALDGRRVRVLNFAMPAGQQPQALMIFAQHAALLDGVITFDGVNEAVIPAYYNRDALPVHFPYRPFYEALFARSLTDEQRLLQRAIEEEQRRESRGWFGRGAAKKKRRIEELTDQLNTLTPTLSALQSTYPTLSADAATLIRAGLDNWRECTRTMRAIAKSKAIELMAVLQPVPERRKSLTELEQRHLADYPDVIEIRSTGYEILSDYVQKLAAEGITCIDFADVFADCPEQIYVDLIHFNDRGCEIVAQRMADLWPVGRV